MAVLAFHGINTSRQKRKVLPMSPVQNVTYVSGRSDLSRILTFEAAMTQGLIEPSKSVKRRSAWLKLQHMCGTASWSAFWAIGAQPTKPGNCKHLPTKAACPQAFNARP
jgi:hypothetical protein